MIRIVLIVLAVLMLYIAWRMFRRWLTGTSPARLAKQLRGGLFGLGLGLVALLLITGKLPILLALVGGVLAVASRLLPTLLQFGPALYDLWRRRGRGTRAGETPQSTVQTRLVRVTLNHGSGELDGEILEGQWAGKHFFELGRDDLVALYQRWSIDDAESAALLEAYLDKTLGTDWRPGASQSAGARPSGGQMTKDEALAILGLHGDATRDEIVAAHRRLMQKVHPDRGGSDYLAAQINLAKDILLGHR